MSNTSELTDFLQTNVDRTKTKERMPTFRFQAQIIYHWKDRTEVFESKVVPEVSGWNDGRITLLPLKDQISSDDFHLDFSPKYQTYKFNKANNSLEISGNSPKMNGNYMVEIHLKNMQI